MCITHVHQQHLIVKNYSNIIAFFLFTSNIWDIFIFIVIPPTSHFYFYVLGFHFQISKSTFKFLIILYFICIVRLPEPPPHVLTYFMQIDHSTLWTCAKSRFVAPSGGGEFIKLILFFWLPAKLIDAIINSLSYSVSQVWKSVVKILV